MEDSSGMHIIKTSEQWNSAAVRYKIIPSSVLCIELTGTGKTYIKIGEGNKYYSQLPYVSSNDSQDLSNYYTKQETDAKLIDKMTFKEIIPSTEQLPVTGNSVGDVYFVEYYDEDNHFVDEYVFTKDYQWKQITHFNTNMPVEDYATKDWVIEYVDSVLDTEHIVYDYDKLILYCNK